MDERCKAGDPNAAREAGDGRLLAGVAIDACEDVFDGDGVALMKLRMCACPGVCRDCSR